MRRRFDIYTMRRRRWRSPTRVASPPGYPQSRNQPPKARFFRELGAYPGTVSVRPAAAVKHITVKMARAELRVQIAHRPVGDQRAMGHAIVAEKGHGVGGDRREHSHGSPLTSYRVFDR